ncbi:hypothetical protein OAN307_c39200 [Octadecabacter antarcticus 307]|uniref:Uncharacterized protein n=1 Tax=Octadecabacter antarcticus 307 TaxID=391626 RepID=M9RAV8_9RHOB|nr:hypothetical protein OAN307_c39200 [Octadecabacter antarcticus 307]
MSASTRLAAPMRACSEGPVSAHLVEKYCVAGAESWALNTARALFFSRFAYLLRCRKDFS